MLQCWKCKKNLGEQPLEVGFRAQCSYCEADLHVCVGCRFYAPGKPNDCKISGTEWIKDREAMNFCEDFASALCASQIQSSQNKSAKDFNSLFKDGPGP